MRRVKRLAESERGADLLSWLVISVPVFIADEPFGPGRAAPLAARAVAALLLASAVAAGRRHPVVAAAVPAAMGLAATAELYTTGFTIAQVLLAFLLGRRAPALRTGLLFFGGVCLAGLALVTFTPGVRLSEWLSMLATALLTIMLPWLTGRYARQHDEIVRAGWELAERLEREQHLAGERARLLERSRIAGDMHDSLGHELSLIALRAAALQVDPRLDPPARQAAGELRAAAARATERLREVIGVLREGGEPAPVLPSDDPVAALVDRAAAAGMAVTLEGELDSLPPMADRAVYRVVQEALTNAAKHAPGASVTVRLGMDRDAGEAVVTVTNTAPPHGPPPRAGSAGHGLIGLDERVRLAGGHLRAGPAHAGLADGGFVVGARLPLVPGAAAGPVGAPPDARRELALARRKVRRSVIDAIWMPVAAATALLALTFGFDVYAARRSVLPAGVYAQMRVGESLPAVEPRLPAYQAERDRRPDGSPQDPPGTDECRFYRTTARSLWPVYRLCFTDGRLTHKDEVRWQDRRRLSG
ncbi:sensor histidine kinase [Nonomuraea aridisoli]|uniref:histidine kinase n=1 Tax=Nonomuraea aridisoli TaxID=2070368 RepID=A0A2W2EAG6_9ACTN|nr:sensor histidine kinase [Nonomuraea aridisoli]PZG14105.1 sensor histidine kinase [Nonomuraea aridisoli]